MRRRSGLFGTVFGLVLLLSSASLVSSSSSPSSGESVEYVVRTSSGGSESSSASAMMDVQNVRVKLSMAEERVKALISKLDAVSEDASRARLEIHSTLLEAWNIVDLLGKDRCGDAVMEVRKKQHAAESRVAELESEIAQQSKSSGHNIDSANKLTLELDSTKQNIEKERTVRTQLEIELSDVRDRLKHALTMTNRSDGYTIVQAQLKQLGLRVSERTDLLKEISQYVKTDLDAEETLENVFHEVKKLIFDHENEYSAAISSLKLDPTQISGLEKKRERVKTQLTEAQKGRENAMRMVDSLQKHLSAMKRSSASGGGAFASRGSVLITLVLMLISIIFGALLVVMGSRASMQDVFRKRENGLSSTPGGGPRYGGNSATPGSAGATPHPLRSSLGNRSSVDTPASRSTPQDYFQAERSPMTYIRSGGSPPYRNY